MPLQELALVVKEGWVLRLELSVNKGSRHSVNVPRIVGSRAVDLEPQEMGRAGVARGRHTYALEPAAFPAFRETLLVPIEAHADTSRESD
jgi:hypothetical protein